MRRQSGIACVSALCLATLLAACNRNSASQLAPSPEHAGRIGDSTAFGLRIVGFNGPRDRATFTLAEPAYVVALAVIPGETIELVARRPGADSTIEAAGEHNVWIAVPRVGVRAPELRLEDRLDYQQCVAQRQLNSRRVQTVTTGRDSAGREITQTIEQNPASYEPAEVECARLLRKSSRARPTPMPDPSRFLVLIASNVRLTRAELDERLSTISVDAKDAQATIAGIAEALYTDRHATWSGYYKRW